MSAPMKRHLTERYSQAQLLYVMDKGQLYAIPKKIVKQYVVETKRALTRPGNVSAEDMFASHDKKYTRAGALLKGLRAREGLSQVVFAKRIGVSQANLSKMENGARPIGMTIAKRIAKSFDVNVNYFSE